MQISGRSFYNLSINGYHGSGISLLKTVLCELHSNYSANFFTSIVYSSVSENYERLLLNAYQVTIDSPSNIINYADLIEILTPKKSDSA